MAEERDALRSRLGRVGIWSFALQTHGAAREREAVAAYEALGYGTIWYPESIGSKDAMAHAAILLEGSDRAVVASGIANIYARDPMAMATGAAALAEAYPGRFVLGIGVSHAPSVETRGAVYEKPVPRMRAYLDAMASAEYLGPRPAQPAPIVLAALGERMLELAAERTAGAHTYFVPVEHTRVAREHLGDAILAVEQTAVLDTDDTRSREVQRRFGARYLALANYANNLRRLGWSEDDVADGGSDRLLDAVIVRGDARAVAARVREQLDAGADHVCVQLRTADLADLCMEAFAELREALAQAGAA
ncbi:MAG TPA: TIGR03620 family F420-dependent LLM class oxidoreductase [Candidatus Dormibacteraeota bacterium]|nr:TIGR03620 family F420-dependent LLM class oxidoreductase [Candidatus Dormibacteraeota bacterium]